MTWNYQLWEEKQSQAWTGHGRMQKVRPQQTYRELLDFAGCRIFSYQTNKHLFQCRLAVELLLLLKLPPKCHTHIPQNLCCSCTSATVPQVWAPPNWMFNVQWQLSFGEVFFSIHEPSVVAQSITPGIMIQAGAVIPWGLSSGSVMSPRDRSCSSRGTEHSAPKGTAGKASHPVMLWRGRKEGRDHSCHSFFSFFDHLHFPLGNILVYNWIPEIEEWFHTQIRKSTSGSTSPTIRLLFKVTDFVPLLQTRQCLDPALCLIVLFSEKESPVFFLLHSRSPNLTTTLLPARKKQNSLLLFLNWHNSAAFFNVTEHHW